MIELINIAILTRVKKLMKKDSKFKIGDTVRITKFRNNFAKDYL